MTETNSKKRTVTRAPIKIEVARAKPGDGGFVWGIPDQPLNADFESTDKALSALRQAAKEGVYRIISVKREKIVVKTENKPVVTLT